MPKTKYLRVAKSGKTIDGREITPAQIDQMAANYDPTKYGARVWMEHLRSFLPDSPFKAYGDVLAVKAANDADGSRVLLAQLDATPDLVKMNDDRQKVYFSIEVFPDFAGTGQAYLGGVAVTDSPASLGTEMLQFNLKSDKAPEGVKAHLFSVHTESPLDLDEQTPPPSPGLLDKVKEMLSGKSKTDDARHTQTEAAVTAVAEEVAKLHSATAVMVLSQEKDIKALSSQVAQLSTQLTDLTTKLSQTDDKPPRLQIGGADTSKTDC